MLTRKTTVIAAQIERGTRKCKMEIMNIDMSDMREALEDTIEWGELADINKEPQLWSDTIDDEKLPPLPLHLRRAAQILTELSTHRPVEEEWKTVTHRLRKMEK